MQKPKAFAATIQVSQKLWVTTYRQYLPGQFFAHVNKPSVRAILT